MIKELITKLKLLEEKVITKERPLPWGWATEDGSFYSLGSVGDEMFYGHAISCRVCNACRKWNNYCTSGSPEAKEFIAESCNSGPILIKEIEKLQTGIKKYLEADGNDLCWENRKELGDLIGIGVYPKLIPEEEFRKNCDKYTKDIYEGGLVSEVGLYQKSQIDNKESEIK